MKQRMIKKVTKNYIQNISRTAASEESFLWGFRLLAIWYLRYLVNYFLLFKSVRESRHFSRRCLVFFVVCCLLVCFDPSTTTTTLTTNEIGSEKKIYIQDRWNMYDLWNWLGIKLIFELLIWSTLFAHFTSRRREKEKRAKSEAQQQQRNCQWINCENKVFNKFVGECTNWYDPCLFRLIESEKRSWCVQNEMKIRLVLNSEWNKNVKTQ